MVHKLADNMVAYNFALTCCYGELERSFWKNFLSSRDGAEKVQKQSRDENMLDNSFYCLYSVTVVSLKKIFFSDSFIVLEEIIIY